MNGASTDERQLGSYIAGRWVTTGRDVSPVLAPTTGQTVAELALATEADIDEAIAAAALTFPLWRRTPAFSRATILRRTSELIRDRRQVFAQCIARELGKPLAEGLRETETAAELFDWAGEECRRSYGRVIPARNERQNLQAIFEPVGPVAAFSSWNAPVNTPARKISGALAAGCSIVLKAAEQTPSAAILLARAVADAGAPPGVLNVVFGDPPLISRRLLDSPAIKVLTFTGSTEVGRLLAAQAGAGLKRMTLELGGHAPVLIFGDVDIDAVATAAVTSKFRNSGQACISPTRFYVHESVYQRFVARFVELATHWRVGDPFDPATQMGPVANRGRLAAMTRLTEDARTRGVRIAAGGAQIGDTGFFWSPTVLLDAGDDCLAANEEPFGPMAVMCSFQTVEEAVTKANRLPQALAAYAFTHDARIVATLRDEVNAGTIAINHWQASWPETPFGGRGASGFGVEGGIEGLQAFQQIKFISTF